MTDKKIINHLSKIAEKEIKSGKDDFKNIYPNN